MDKDFEQTMAILSGGSADKFIAQQLNATDKRQIDNAIEEIFSGLSLKNWLAGGVLGDAWNNAQDAVRDMVFAIQFDNPATVYARASVFEHRKKIRTQSVYSPHINNAINCTNEQRNSWYESAIAKIQNGQEMLMRKVKEFNSDTPRKSVNFVPINMSINHTTKHVRENEHERKK